MVSITPAKKIRAREPSVTAWPIRVIISAWKRREKKAAARADRANTTRAGSLFQIISSVSSGTIMSQGVIRKVD